MTETFTLFVDGLKAEARKGAMLLQVIRKMGIHVPTLCHHPSLEPTGACRLCVVEITHPDWGGWSGLVTSCLYPVEAGVQVLTRSERVTAVRRILLEMLLARCPDAEAVRRLARAEGVETTSFPVRDGADKCVMCGLCVRVCQDLGPAALAPLGRGSEKEVGPRPDKVGEDCTGCGACALVCPTGEIVLDRSPGRVAVWNREFQAPPYSVRANDCRGCGVCEEVCPLAIPRVVHWRNGSLTARIEAGVCVSCGLCAGACPTGAIGAAEVEGAGGTGTGAGASGRPAAAAAVPQADLSLPTVDLKNHVVLFACGRSPLPAGALPEMVAPVVVPCVGRVTVEAILECLARRADGVLVMGRDQATCAFSPGEDQAAERVAAAEELLALAGLGTGRVQFVVPAAGYEGPAAAARAFREAIEPTPLRAALPGTGPGSLALSLAGLDRGLAIAAWLFERPELAPVVPSWLSRHFDEDTNDATLLYLGDLPALDLLLSLLSRGRRLDGLFADAAALLDEKGIRCRPVMTRREVDASRAGRVIAFCRECLPRFARKVEVLTLDALAGAGSAAAGQPAAPRHRAGPQQEHGFSFRIAAEERTLLAAAAAARGEHPLACPGQVAQALLLARDGAWQAGLAPEPLMAFQQMIRRARLEKAR